MRAIRLLIYLALGFSALNVHADITCCGEWITEPGSAGLCRNEECCANYMHNKVDRASICQDLTAKKRLCPDVKPWCGVDCQAEADKLVQAKNEALARQKNNQDEITKDKVLLAKAKSEGTSGIYLIQDHIRDMEKDIATRQAELEAIKAKYQDLLLTCPALPKWDPGTPKPTGSPVPMTDVKTPAGTLLADNAITQIEAEIDSTKRWELGLSAVCNFNSSITVNIPPGTPVVTLGVDLPAACKGLVIWGFQTRQLALHAQIRRIKKIIHDPPSAAYHEVVRLPRRDLPLNYDATYLQRAARQMALHELRAGDNLEAFLASYERYQGALADKQWDDARKQAWAMRRFSAGALRSALAAQTSRFETERRLCDVWQKNPGDLSPEKLAFAVKTVMSSDTAADYLKGVQVPADIDPSIVEAARTRKPTADAESIVQLVLKCRDRLTFLNQMRKTAATDRWPGSSLVPFIEMLRMEAERAYGVSHLSP